MIISNYREIELVQLECIRQRSRRRNRHRLREMQLVINRAARRRPRYIDEDVEAEMLGVIEYFLEYEIADDAISQLGAVRITNIQNHFNLSTRQTYILASRYF